MKKLLDKLNGVGLLCNTMETNFRGYLKIKF